MYNFQTTSLSRHVITGQQAYFCSSVAESLLSNWKKFTSILIFLNTVYGIMSTSSLGFGHFLGIQKEAEIF